MNAENFADILKNSSQLYQLSYQELKSLVLQYPYCRNLHYLLLRKSHINQRADFERILEKTATYSIDRRYLYLEMRDLQPQEDVFSDSFELREDYLELHDLTKLEKDREPIPLHILREEEESSLASSNGQSTEKSGPFFPDLPVQEDESRQEDFTEEEDLFIPPLDLNETATEEPAPVSGTEVSPELPFHPDGELILNFAGGLQAIEILEWTEPDPSESREAFSPAPVLLADLAAMQVAVEQLYAVSSAVGPTKAGIAGRPQPKPKSSFKSWVKQFQPDHMQPHLDELMENVKPVKKTPKKKSRVASFAEQSLREHEELVSETLAGLLVQQERYEKAIEMYRRLSLIFPEKNSYFAQIIQELQKRQ